MSLLFQWRRTSWRTPEVCLLGQNPWWTSTHERKRDVAVPSGFLSSSAGCRQVSITSDAPCFDWRGSAATQTNKQTNTEIRSELKSQCFLSHLCSVWHWKFNTCFFNNHYQNHSWQISLILVPFIPICLAHIRRFLFLISSFFRPPIRSA